MKKYRHKHATIEDEPIIVEVEEIVTHYKIHHPLYENGHRILRKDIFVDMFVEVEESNQREPSAIF